MSKRLGQVYFAEERRPYFLDTAPPPTRGDYSEATAQMIDQEIKEIIDEQYQRAKEILMGKKEPLGKGQNYRSGTGKAGGGRDKSSLSGRIGKTRSFSPPLTWEREKKARGRSGARNSTATFLTLQGDDQAMEVSPSWHRKNGYPIIAPHLYPHDQCLGVRTRGSLSPCPVLRKYHRRVARYDT